jgi:hypothetical protein
MPGPRITLLVLATTLAVAGAGCGDDEAPPPPAPPEGPFAVALRSVSTGEVPVGEGFGFIDAQALAPADFDWAARALGPGGTELITNRKEIEASAGFDPESADQLVAVATSYTLGVRADGVDPRGLERSVGPAADREAQQGEWQLFNLGRAWSVPNDTPAEPMSGLGARIAIGRDSAVLARTERARAGLITPSTRVLSDPGVRLALDCLGDVVAARIIPSNFTHAPNSGPELLAFGVTDAGPPGHEVLCAIDRDDEDVSAAADEMRERLAPDALDPVTSAPVGEEVAESVVDELSGDGVSAARAKLTLADGEQPGMLFGAFVRGSLVTYLGVADSLGEGEPGLAP